MYDVRGGVGVLSNELCLSELFHSTAGVCDVFQCLNVHGMPAVVLSEPLSVPDVCVCDARVHDVYECERVSGL